MIFNKPKVRRVWLKSVTKVNWKSVRLTMQCSVLCGHWHTILCDERRLPIRPLTRLKGYDVLGRTRRPYRPVNRKHLIDNHLITDHITVGIIFVANPHKSRSIECSVWAYDSLIGLTLQEWAKRIANSTQKWYKSWQKKHIVSESRIPRIMMAKMLYLIPIVFNTLFRLLN